MTTKQCPTCNKQINYRSSSCTNCAIINFGKLPISNFRDKGNGRLNKVRDHAQRVYYSNKDATCLICGYNLFIDVCHIKDLHCFADNTPISIVNSQDNLLGLCPNCHREFDNGLIPDEVLLSLGVTKDIINLKKKDDRVCTCSNCGQLKSAKSSVCARCLVRPTKIIWPSDEELKKLVWEKSLYKIGVELGVSDKTIKKHCKSRGIDTPGVGYWAKFQKR